MVKILTYRVAELTKLEHTSLTASIEQLDLIEVHKMRMLANKNY